MEIFTICVLMFAFLALAVAAFAAGPYVLQWFFDTLEEWEEIIARLHDEK